MYSVFVNTSKLIVEPLEILQSSFFIGQNKLAKVLGIFFPENIRNIIISGYSCLLVA